MHRLAISGYTKLLIALSFVTMIMVIILNIPPDMDMYLQFHPIACRYFPLGHLHTFRESCKGEYDIIFPGGFVWPRSSQFQGLAYAILYFPLYLLFPYWQSGIALCAILMMVTLYFFARATGISLWIAILVMGINFFYMFNTLYDLGPSALHVMTIFTIPALTLMAMRSRGWARWIGLNIGLALLVFLCVEYKFSFIYYMPAAIIITWSCLPQQKTLDKARAAIGATWLGALVFLVLFAFLLTATRAGVHDEFWNLIRDTRSRYPNYTDAWEYLNHLADLVSRYLLDFVNSAAIIYVSGTWGLPRLMVLEPSPNYTHMLLTAPFWVSAIGIFIYFYRDSARHKHSVEIAAYRRRVTGTLCAGIFTFLLVGLNEYSRHAAHLLPPMACFVASIAIAADYLCRRKIVDARWLVLVVCVTQLSITGYTANQKVVWHEYSWDRFKVMEFARKPIISENSIIAVSDWGVYYIASLYGPRKQLVVYIQDFPPEEIDKLIALAHDQKRYLTFLQLDSAYGSDWFKMLLTKLPHLKKIYPKKADGHMDWHIWSEFDPYEDPAKGNASMHCAPNAADSLTQYPLFIRY